MPHPSPLLTLPKELRLCILDQLFASQKDITIGLPSRTPWHCKPQAFHPPIAEVCHQLRRDALPLLYHSRRVVVLLRYREGRAQVRRWIALVLRRPEICRHIEEISIQYFEQPHRSTALLLNVRGLRIENRESWTHPLIGAPLKLLGDTERALRKSPLSRLEALEGRPLKVFVEAEEALRSARLTTIADGTAYCDALCALVGELVELMLASVQSSRLLRCESMANLRLHGYTDFQLRFEVISIMYSSVDRC